jgi:hypothetical protein
LAWLAVSRRGRAVGVSGAAFVKKLHIEVKDIRGEGG